MRISIIVMFLLIANSGLAQHKGLVNTLSKKFAQDTIVWRRDSLLTADNFKSKGKKDQVAFTSSAIFFHTAPYDPSVFYVEAVFLKSGSYIRENAPYVLKHEQLHFDITELYARKLRQMIKTTDFKKSKKIYRLMFKGCIIEWLLKKIKSRSGTIKMLSMD